MTAAAAPALAANIERVRERIALACQRAGRRERDVTLIGVSKTHPAATVREAFAAGLRDFGENRVQEALPKQDEAGELPGAAWHLIGHLQSNKVRAVAGRFAILHGIDSERTLRAVGNAAPGEPQRVFIEVNVAAEESKFGVAPAALLGLVEIARSLPAIRLEGLMTVAPMVPDAEQARPVFTELARLARDLDLPCLSMGMTGDFEVAIEQGATHVRVGRAIFGERLQ